MVGAVGDLIVQNTSTVGTGSLTLTTAVAPYLTAAQAGMRDGDTVEYSITDGATASEAGFGVLSGTQTALTRNVVTSSNSNALISCSGTAVVRLSPQRSGLQAFNRQVAANYGII